MSDLQRVPAPRLPFGRHGELAALVLDVIVGILVVKPWGDGTGQLGDADAGPTRALPTATPPVAAAPTPFEAGYVYDQSIFGPFEPNPEWSVWPGGFFVTVLYVTREAEVPATASPGPPAVSPGASVGPSGSGPPPSPEVDGWPAAVVIGPGDHLLWLGLDTPRAWTVREARVWRVNEDGSRAPVPVVELPSQWGPHLTIIGIPVAEGSERLSIWPKGSYDLEVTLDPDGSQRSIRVEIQTLPEPTPSPEDQPR